MPTFIGIRNFYKVISDFITSFIFCCSSSFSARNRSTSPVFTNFSWKSPSTQSNTSSLSKGTDIVPSSQNTQSDDEDLMSLVQQVSNKVEDSSDDEMFLPIHARTDERQRGNMYPVYAASPSSSPVCEESKNEKSLSENSNKDLKNNLMCDKKREEKSEYDNSDKVCEHNGKSIIICFRSVRYSIDALTVGS